MEKGLAVLLSFKAPVSLLAGSPSAYLLMYAVANETEVFGREMGDFESSE